MQEIYITLKSEQDTQKVAMVLSANMNLLDNTVIYLHGNLGAGKTTFSKYFITSFHYNGTVKSPTYTLIEPYELESNNINHKIYHLDLYRISDPQELNYLGLEDIVCEKNAILLIEWPERGRGFLPQADIELNLEYSKNIDNNNTDTVRGLRIIFNKDYSNITLWQELQGL